MTTELVLAAGFTVGVDDGELAARLGQGLGLVPGSGRLLCTLRVDRTAPGDHRHGPVEVAGEFEVGCVLECAPTAKATTILVWLNALLVKVGVLPLHASAFARDGVAVAVVGRAHSGKTGALLAARINGWSALGDECIWLAEGRLTPVSVPLEVRVRYLDEMPEYLRCLPRRAVWRARLFAGLARRVIARSPTWGRRFDARAKVIATPDDLFGGYGPPHRLDHLVISTCVQDAPVSIEPLDLPEAHRELLEIQMTELEPVLEVLARRNTDQGDALRLAAQLAELIEAALASVRTHRLTHAYPVPAHELVHVIFTKM